MKMEEHFKETLSRAVANEPPVVDAWDRFEQRALRGRRIRLFAAIAAATAVAVASVIVVPRLGTGGGIGLSTEPPSPSPTPTVDAYAGWKTFEYELYDFRLRYPQDWSVAGFEADPEILAPGQKGTAEGGETMAVTLALVNEEYDTPALRRQGFDRSTRPDGVPFVSNERMFEGRTFVDYRIEWSECMPTPEPSPTGCGAGDPRTLVVTIHIGNKDLENEYRAIAEKIVTSIEFTGLARGRSFG